MAPRKKQRNKKSARSKQGHLAVGRCQRFSQNKSPVRLCQRRGRGHGLRGSACGGGARRWGRRPVAGPQQEEGRVLRVGPVGSHVNPWSSRCGSSRVGSRPFFSSNRTGPLRPDISGLPFCKVVGLPTSRPGRGNGP